MAIDLGNTPTGTPPTAGEKLQIRSAIGVGTTDAPTFLGVNGPTGKGAINLSVGGAYAEITYNSVSMLQWAATTLNLNTPVIRLGSTVNAYLAVDTANILEQRNGTAKQALRVYNTNLAGAPEWAEFDWITSGGTNTLRIGTNKSGDGAARPIEFVTGGVANVSISSLGALTVGRNTNPGSIAVLNTAGSSNIQLSGQPAYGYHMAAPVLITWGNATQLNGTLDTGLERIAGGTVGVNTGTTGTFGFLKAKLQTSTAYTATVVTPTGFLTLYDSTGTAYRVPCVV